MYLSICLSPSLALHLSLSSVSTLRNTGAKMCTSARRRQIIAQMNALLSPLL